MARGRLRVYMGAAPGVGKTYAMLEEGHRLGGEGLDVVVAYVETHQRSGTAALVEGLEVVPRTTFAHSGLEVEEMDLEAVLRRHPEVALVDELAHTNATGARHEKRWRDVQDLLDAGIDVITTLNVQHLDSLNDVVETITGVRQRETIPDEVVRGADQVELVDLTSEGLRKRMLEGSIYAPEKVEQALSRYFRPGNLDALRELSLLWVADRVDEALRRYRSEHGIDTTWETRERTVVALTGAPSGERLIRRAARLAERAHGGLVGVHVRSADGRHSAAADLLERHRVLLESLGGSYHEVVAEDAAAALVAFARRMDATQVVLGASSRSRWAEISRGSVINQVVRRSGDIDVHVISHLDDAEAPRTRPVGPIRRSPLTRRRLTVGWSIAVGGTSLTTLALANARPLLEQGGRFLVLQAVVLASAATGGAGPAVVSALLAATYLNWYFTPPQYTWTIADPENLLALIIFAVLGVAVGLLVTAFARRTAEARRYGQEAEALANIASGLVSSDRPVHVLLERARTMLGVEGVTLVDASGDPVDHVGQTAQRSPAEAVEMDHGMELHLTDPIGVDDRRVLEAFAEQLTRVIEREQLGRAAADVERLAAGDALRTALLRAVSHDLRTPLASIKASVTSLLQDDVGWSDAERSEFLQTIDEEGDRLDRLVANLLDASRLQVGAMEPRLRPVALDEVIPGALDSISHLKTPVRLDLPDTLPLVMCDPGLLERAIANVVTNADAHSPPGATIDLAARATTAGVDLFVRDHGNGVPTGQLDRIFEPFQRLGDHGSGVGLGLSVARGMLEAMGGHVGATGPDGGGLCVVMTLRAVSDDG